MVTAHLGVLILTRSQPGRMQRMSPAGSAQRNKSLWRRDGKKREGKSLFIVVGSGKGRAGALTLPGGAQHTQFLFSQAHVSFKML